MSASATVEAQELCFLDRNIKALSLGKQCLCCQACPSLVPAAWGCSLGPISSPGLRVPEVLQPLCVGPAVEQCQSIARKDCPGHIAQGYVKRWGSAVGTWCATLPLLGGEVGWVLCC